MEKDLSSLYSISDEPEKAGSFTTVIYNKGTIVEPEAESNEPSRPKSNRLCFNCGKDDHALRDCPKPHNPARISKNRSQFVGRGLNKGAEFTRYHKEIDDRFSDFRPGILSNKLKEALGLKRDKLPRYIYNMRRLGYPPGWLEEAKISHSGINMLDSNGERVPDPDEEEGEICTTRVKYDVTKIVNYPGFNVWPDPGTINETETYGSLPMCYDQSKEAFIERLNDSSFTNEYPVELSLASKFTFNCEDEMDIEELDINVKYDSDSDRNCGFIPPLPDENPPTPPPLPPSVDGPRKTAIDGDVINIDSGEELSSEQEEGELPSKASSKIHRASRVTKRSPTSERERSRSPLSSPSKEDKVVKDDNIDEKWTPPKFSRPVHSSNETTDPVETFSDPAKKFGKVKSIELGTPVLIHSSYKALPSPEKFRKDISDVVYFENLPNSTGKYERLKNVLKSVRSKLNLLKGGSSSITGTSAVNKI